MFKALSMECVDEIQFTDQPLKLMLFCGFIVLVGMGWDGEGSWVEGGR